MGFLFWGLQRIAAFVLAPIPLAQIVFLLAVAGGPAFVGPGRGVDGDDLGELGNLRGRAGQVAG